MRDLVTVENLKTALEVLFEKEGAVTDKGWIDQIAQFIMDFFGYEERILDNRLTPKDRDVFYMLEGMGLLKTEMEEATIQKGKVWRIHYWILNRERIEELVKIPAKEEEEEADSEDETIYDSISDSMWDMHR
ncbi:MAG: DUF6015 family protein [Thermoplasmatota archaeon]